MDNENKNENNIHEDNHIRKTSGKEIKKHLWVFLLVAFGVLLYLALNNLGAIGGALLYTVNLLSPLFIGALLALILNTPMCAIEQFLTWIFKKLFSKKDKEYKPNKRGIEISALVLTILLALLIIYIIVYSVVPQIIESVKTLFIKAQVKIPEYLKLLEEYEDFEIDTASIWEWISTFDFNSIFNKITDNAGGIINTVISGASSIISGTFTAFTSVIFAVYLLVNKRTMSVQMKRLSYAHFSKEKVDKSIELFSTVGETFSNFISGQCLDATILGLMMFVSMSIFGFPYALPVSAMITITALIPYIGAFLGTVFGVLLIMMDSPLLALLFVILFLCIQQVDNHIVYPRVVGSSVGLPPIWTFVAVIVGGALFGIIGMILFIPLFSVFYTIIRKNVARRLEERGIVVEEPDYQNEEKPKKPGRIFTLVSKGIGSVKKVVTKSKHSSKKRK